MALGSVRRILDDGISNVGKSHVVIMFTVGPDDVAEEIASSRATASS
jgi:hypothetical protein